MQWEVVPCEKRKQKEGEKWGKEISQSQRICILGALVLTGWVGAHRGCFRGVCITLPDMSRLPLGHAFKEIVVASQSCKSCFPT